MINGKKVLITGACGTVGSELVNQLLSIKYKVKSLIGLDNNESDLFYLEQFFGNDKRASFFLADMRDAKKICRKSEGIDIIFHAAAFKHVISCEKSPFEAVQTNIVGVQNVIAAAHENHVEKVIFTSTDKAVNPTSVMGTSKLLGEKLITAANANQINGKTIFASTRFGNVLGSRGSVIPIFREQIKKGGPVTLTDPLMTRFIMSIQEAVKLVINSSILANGGEVFITKMPVINIFDLAKVMIEELSPFYGHDIDKVKITTIGQKPGEKLYEELMNHEETRRSLELPNYFSVLPAFIGENEKNNYTYPEIIRQKVSRPYNSNNEDVLSKNDLRKFLHDNHLLLPER